MPRASRARRGPRRVVFEAASALSGPIQVVDEGDLRRLVVGGDTLSIVSLSGDWSRLEREYWSRALDAVDLPPRPSALFLWAGGGTQPLLLHARARPRWVTVVERDPVILDVARRYFGLARLERAEFLCGEVEEVLPCLLSSGRRFDFIMDDATYAEAAERVVSVALRLGRVLGRRGVLVLNRHARHQAARIAAALRRGFAGVSMRRVRCDAGNVLIWATDPRR